MGNEERKSKLMMDILQQLEAIERMPLQLMESEPALPTTDPKPISHKEYLNKIEDFVFNLNPTDVGMEEFGPFRVHYEGFSDDCIQDAEDRCHLPKDHPRHLEQFEDIYDEVLRDFINRERGKFPLKHELTGDEENPIYYAIFSDDESIIIKEEKQNFPNSLTASELHDLVSNIHRDEQDFSEGDLTDRIYWFKNYRLVNLELSRINMNEYSIDMDLVEDYIQHIKDSPDTMPPVVFDLYNSSVIDGIHRANAYKLLGINAIPAYVGEEKSESFGERENYDEIYEASPNTIEGSFTPDLVKSKQWLAGVLSKILKGKKVKNIYVLGSWYGNMGIYLQEAGIKFEKLILVDPDEKKAVRAKELLADINDKLVILTQKAEDVVYEEKSVIINTSCNETGPMFLTKIPKKSLCLLQARNNVDSLVETESLEEFDELYPLTKTILLKDKMLKDPETKYYRYMKVGLK